MGHYTSWIKVPRFSLLTSALNEPSVLTLGAYITIVPARHAANTVTRAMPVNIVQDNRRTQIQLADEKLLAELGYKQEFKREFTPVEVR